MAVIKKGILGGFSGTVGTVIGGTWKGITYMRSKATSTTNPRTEAQQVQRAKFALAVRFLRPCTDFIRTGYKNYAVKKTSSNAALSYILANAVTGSYPHFTIDPSRVLVSRGSLTTPVNVSVQANGPGSDVKISWDDNSAEGSARQTNRALALIINSDKGEVAYKTAGALRNAGEESLYIPVNWASDTVDVYLGFISENGMDVSNSVYGGQITIL